METERVTGAEAVEFLLSRNYVTRLCAGAQRCGLSIANTVVGPVSLGRARFDMVADLRGGRRGVVGIGRARAGRLSYDYSGEELRWERGNVFVAVEPASEYVLHVEDLDVDHTVIDMEVFDQIAQPPPGERLRLTGHAPVSPQAAATWLRAWTAVSDLATETAGPVTPLVAGQAARLLAAVTLATFPHNGVLETTIDDRRDAHPAALRRAISYIEANADLDLTVVDIARSAYVSTRSVQLAFRRHLDTTPMAYLRRLRLDRAHTELLAAVPGDGTTVTGVSARWGWSRPSRFAADYRAAYGRHPHQVLRSGG